MKTKTLHIKFQSLDDFRKEGLDAVKNNKASIQKKNEIFFLGF